ncbi:MAG: VIT domain-containing protein [Polyangiaceae bacterium]
MNPHTCAFGRLNAALLVLSSALSLSACTNKPRAAEATAGRGRVLRVVEPSSGPGVQVCDPNGATCVRALVGTRVPAGSVLRSGAQSSAQILLAEGSQLSLDHDSELVLPGNGARHARLKHGAIVLELAFKSASHARIDVNDATVELSTGKIALRDGVDFAILDVIRGGAKFSQAGAAPLQVSAGEEARCYRGSAPYVSSGAVLTEAVSFSDSLLDAAEPGSASRGLGELTARKPGATEELRSAVKLAAHSVRVRIAGAMARTEIDEVFENSTDDVLEGIYRFPIPSDAKIERLALEVDGKLEEGAFVDRDRAAAIWRGAIVHAAPNARQQIRDDIVWVPGPWRDPALLEWQRGGRFELKIFPIPKHGQRRIVLAYTEAVRPVGGVRHFTYPLPVDPGGTTTIRHFDVDVEVRGQDPEFAVRSLGYPLTSTDRNGARALTFSADNFTPNGDLSVEWALPGRQSELTSFGYRAGDERYALLTLRPQLPRTTVDRVHATVIVVDASRSMYGEGLERAKRLATRLTRELDPAGSVTVLTCDNTCREMPQFLSPGPAAALQAQRFFESTTAEGASDPTQAIAIANRALSEAPAGQVKDIIYIGDGTPTVGPIRTATVTAAVRDALANSSTRLTAVAVGSASDLDTLSAMARAGGGLVLPYAPGQTLSEATLGVLSATYGSALRDVEVVLPSGLRALAPQKLDTLLAGSEASISARMDSDAVDGPLILRGKLGDTAFEQRYDVHVSASDSPGNAFVPRVYAAARIADLEQNGSPEAKKEALTLSTRFSVASRYTSLLVLESEAMLRAFGLDTSVKNNRFTGEEVAEQSEAKAELPLDDSENQDTLGMADKKSAGAPSDAYAAREAAPAPASAPKAAASMGRASSAGSATDLEQDFAQPPSIRRPAAASPNRFAQPLAPDFPVPENRRHLVPMRRVWDRKGQVRTQAMVPRAASITAVADAERALAANPDRRSALKKAYSLYAASADLGRAASLVEHWLSKEPLDPDALTARADLAARRGDRELAVRMLGSVVDVRPDDVAAQKRLARLYRWSGRADLGCRHAMAIAELRASDAHLLADALRCARSGNDARWASNALSLADEKTARLAETLASGTAPDDTRLRGDLRVEATWAEDADLDLALLHPDGQRVSWLGAPTREVISARDVLTHGREGLALNGAKPGEYVVEIVRSSTESGPVRGELTVFVAGETRRIPFTLEGARMTVALAEIKMVPRLIPLAIGDSWSIAN